MCLSWSRKQNKNPRNLEHPHSGGLTVQITKHKLLTLKPSKYKLFPPRKEKWLDAKSKHPMQHFTSQERKLTKKGFHAKRKKKSLAKSKVCLRQEKKNTKTRMLPSRGWALVMSASVFMIPDAHLTLKKITRKKMTLLQIEIG